MSNAKTKKRQSKNLHYASYKLNGTWLKNKIRALKRHISMFPSDQAAQAALQNLESGRIQYHRKRPVKRIWRRSKARMEYAHILRTLGNSGDWVLRMPWELGHPNRNDILPNMR